MSGPNPANDEEHIESTEALWIFERSNVDITHEKNHLLQRHGPNVSDHFVAERVFIDGLEIASRFFSNELISEWRGRFLAAFEQKMNDPAIQQRGRFTDYLSCDTWVGEALIALSRDPLLGIESVKTKWIPCNEVTFVYDWDRDRQCWVEVTGYPSGKGGT